MRFIKPEIFHSARIISAVSTRKGGVSKGFYATLNTGRSTSDDQNDVEENRRLFFSDLGITEEQTALSYQVHGCEILKAENPCRENGYDALITNRKNLFLVVSVADCIPILIHDPKKEAVAAVHAGWRGTASNIVLKTLQALQSNYGSAPEDCLIYIGPGLCQPHFEVGDEVAAHFSDNHKHFDTSLRKYFVDLKNANRDMALSFGVAEKNIEVSKKCTFCEENMFFSHRRDKGHTGRMAAVIGMI